MYLSLRTNLLHAAISTNEWNFHSFLPMPTEKVKLIILDRELISHNKKYLQRFNFENGKTADDAAVLRKLKLHQVENAV